MLHGQGQAVLSIRSSTYRQNHYRAADDNDAAEYPPFRVAHSCFVLLVVCTHVLDEQVDQALQDEGVADGMASFVGNRHTIGIGGHLRCSHLLLAKDLELRSLNHDLYTIINIHACMRRLGAELATVERVPRIVNYQLSIVH